MILNAAILRENVSDNLITNTRTTVHLRFNARVVLEERLSFKYLYKDILYIPLFNLRIILHSLYVDTLLSQHTCVLAFICMRVKLMHMNDNYQINEDNEIKLPDLK